MSSTAAPGQQPQAPSAAPVNTPQPGFTESIDHINQQQQQQMSFADPQQPSASYQPPAVTPVASDVASVPYRVLMLAVGRDRAMAEKIAPSFFKADGTMDGTQLMQNEDGSVHLKIGDQAAWKDATQALGMRSMESIKATAKMKIAQVGEFMDDGEPGDTGGLQAAGLRPTPGYLLRAALPFLQPEPAMRLIEPGAPAWRSGWVCGAVFLVRSDLMRKLGGFDSRFFLYWEETDVCKRAEDAGFETWAVGAAVAHHVGGASSSSDDTRVGGCIAKHYYQSRFYYLAKHHGWLAAAAVDAVEYVMTGLRAAIDALSGRGWTRLRPRLQARLFSQPEQV